MPYIYQVFERLLRLWMGIWLHTHIITTILWINLLKWINAVRVVLHSSFELSWSYCNMFWGLYRTYILPSSHQNVTSGNQYFLHFACKGLLWNMEQSGGFARDLCVVGLSKHLPEYLPSTYCTSKNKKNTWNLWYSTQCLQKKKIKHYGKTPQLHLLVFQVNWVLKGNFGGMIILPTKITSTCFE